MRTIIEYFRWWNRDCKRCRCDRCSHEYIDAPQDMPIEIEKNTYLYTQVRCPECLSGNVGVTHTIRPFRHHKCGQCGNRFKTKEL